MRCEDYPCCGHTDGLPCDWTYTPAARAFDRAHFACDHEMGYCEAEEEGPEFAHPDDLEEMADFFDPTEDQWLDGSYEE